MIIDVVLATLLLLSLGVVTYLYWSILHMGDTLARLRDALAMSTPSVWDRVEEQNTKVIVRDSDWRDDEDRE